MDLSQLNQVPWWTALIGYSYALFCGHFFIEKIMEHTRFLVDPNRNKDPRWQPFITGITERTLYVSSLLVDKGEFIIFWVTLKMALQYRRWTGGD